MFNPLLNLSRVVKSCTVLAAVLCSGLLAQGQVYVLSDGNSSAAIDVGSPQGMISWELNSVNHLNFQTFMIGVNGAAENTLNTLSPGVFVPQNGTRGATITYGNALVTVQVDYLLTGMSATSSDIGESIRITNPTASAISVHFFQYSDFNLGGNGMNDTVGIASNPFTHLYGAADQWDGTIAFSESVHSPGANFAEVNISPATYNMLTDGVPSTLNDNVGPITGNVTWAFQWNFTIAAGDSVLISKDKFLTSTVVPEPSVLGLISVGLLGAILRRRRS